MNISIKSHGKRFKGVPNSPVKCWDKRVKVEKNPFNFSHSVIQISTYGVGGSDETGLFKAQFCSGPALWSLSREGGCREDRAKISNKSHPRNHQHTV